MLKRILAAIAAIVAAPLVFVWEAGRWVLRQVAPPYMPPMATPESVAQGYLSEVEQPVVGERPFWAVDVDPHVSTAWAYCRAVVQGRPLPDMTAVPQHLRAHVGSLNVVQCRQVLTVMPRAMQAHLEGRPDKLLSLLPTMEQFLAASERSRIARLKEGSGEGRGGGGKKPAELLQELREGFVARYSPAPR